MIVPKIPLGKIVQFEKGKRPKQKGEGNYKVIGGGVNESGYTDTWNYEDEITIAYKGSPGIVAYRPYKFWAEEACLVVKHSFLLDKRFLYHTLKSKEWLLKQLGYGLIQNLDIERVNNIEIGVPGIDEQIEIAEKIDKFARLQLEREQQLVEDIEQVSKAYRHVSNEIFGTLNKYERI